MFALPKDKRKHGMFLVLHKHWQDYIAGLIEGRKADQETQRRLNEADLHGCKVLVESSPQPSHTGFEGIVVRDTASTLHIISEDDHMRVVPKAGGLFSFTAGNFRIRLCGADML